MRYDDRPLWEINARQMAPHQPLPLVAGKKEDKPWPGFSPLYRWYYRENARRNRKEINEIDIAEIKAVLQGVKNKWIILKNEKPDILNKIALNENGFDWRGHWEELVCLHR